MTSLLAAVLMVACGVAERDPVDEPDIPPPATDSTEEEASTTTEVISSDASQVTTDIVEEEGVDQPEQDSSGDKVPGPTTPPTSVYVPPTTKDGLPHHPKPSIPPPRG